MELLEDRPEVKIYGTSPWKSYQLEFPEFSEQEKRIISDVNRVLLRQYTPEDLEVMFVKDKEHEGFVQKVDELSAALGALEKPILSREDEGKYLPEMKKFLAKISRNLPNEDALSRVLLHDILGMSILDYLLSDDELEELMINGARKNIFVHHRKHGLCKTNLRFDSNEQLLALISKASNYVKKPISIERPTLDAHLPDGSRLNATIPPASPLGPTLTIRKFGIHPLTITELISKGTVPPVLAGFLWMAVEGFGVYPLNMIIAGGTGSGKTTTVNALSVFMPEDQRVITIEDTLELNLYERENWVQLEAIPGIYEDTLTVNALLKNSLRMRPDRLLIGEVRGEEAETMFIAMDVGHQGVMSTLHANSAKECLLRLQSAPMSVPKAMFTLLDMIIMQHRLKTPQGAIRRITEVSEVSLMGDELLLNNIFSFDRTDMSLKRTSIPSQSVEKIASLSGRTKNEISQEISARAKVLNAMVEQKIWDYHSIRKVVSNYASDPSGFFQDASDQ